MKLQYSRDTDKFRFELNAKPSTASREIAADVVADFDADGNLVGIHIDHASQRMDLRLLETKAIPATTVKIG
jgi:uncharacterized protein YuzE